MFTVAYTIEFQKRGLPHAHIVIWLDESDKCKNTDDIDFLISAEIPDKNVDPIGYECVSKFMVHGPCGELNPKCACMKDHKCTKFFPKDYSNETVIDSKGYAIYKRRNDGRTIMCKDVAVDNRYYFHMPFTFLICNIVLNLFNLAKGCITRLIFFLFLLQISAHNIIFNYQG